MKETAKSIGIELMLMGAGYGVGKVVSKIRPTKKTVDKAGLAVNNGSNIGAGDIEWPVQAAINTEVKTSAIVAEDLSYTHNHVPGHKRHAARVEGEATEKFEIKASTRNTGTQNIIEPKLEHNDPVYLKHKPGTNRQVFDKKADALQKLGKDNQLRKVTNVVRDPKITDNYRKQVLKNAKNQFGEQNPEFIKNIEKRLKHTLDADHTHELQLGGKDITENLKLLDKSVNRSIGKQIQIQIKDIPEGAIIINIQKK
jgi:hypothetical protein